MELAKIALKAFCSRVVNANSKKLFSFFKWLKESS